MRKKTWRWFFTQMLFLKYLLFPFSASHTPQKFFSAFCCFFLSTAERICKAQRRNVGGGFFLRDELSWKKFLFSLLSKWKRKIEIMFLGWFHFKCIFLPFSSLSLCYPPQLDSRRFGSVVQIAKKNIISLLLTLQRVTK